MSLLVPLKRAVEINARLLPEETPGDFSFRYIDISSVGHGRLVIEPARIDFGSAPSRARRIVSIGDTLVSTVRTYLKAVLPVRENGFIASTGFACLTPGVDTDARYLSWWTLSSQFTDEISARSVGVSYPAINPSDLATLPFPLRELHEQRAIADFLDYETARIDALLAKKLSLLLSLEERFRRLVDELTNIDVLGAIDPATKLPGKWRYVMLRRCFSSIQYGIGEATNDVGSYSVLGMGNIDDHGAIIGAPGGFVDEVDPSLLVRPGDLLFNRTNSLAKVGKAGLVRDLQGSTTFASYLVRLRVNELADSNYLNYALNTVGFLRLARSVALPSIGQANLNPARYTELRIPLPPLREQVSIAATLDQERAHLAALRSRIEWQIDLLRERKQALITGVVTGEMAIAGVSR